MAFLLSKESPLKSTPTHLDLLVYLMSRLYDYDLVFSKDENNKEILLIIVDRIAIPTDWGRAHQGNIKLYPDNGCDIEIMFDKNQVELMDVPLALQEPIQQFHEAWLAILDNDGQPLEEALITLSKKTRARI